MTEPALVPPPSQESDPSLRPSEGGPDLMEEAHPALTTASPESVRTATLAGVRWGVMARFGIETASFLSTVILARLINPAGFGHAATALAIIAIATGLTVEGFGTPLVQRKNVLRAHVEVSLLLSVTSGLAMTVLVFLLAPLLTGALGHENVALIQLASPAFFAVSLCAIPQALQQRRLNFRATSLIEVSSLGVGVAGSIVLAVAGLGARALVLGQILIPISASVMYLAVTPLMFPRWHRREARDIVGFGSRTTLSSSSFLRVLEHRLCRRQLEARRAGDWLLLACVPDRGRISGQDQRDHAASGAADLFAHPRPRRYAADSQAHRARTRDRHLPATRDLRRPGTGISFRWCSEKPGAPRSFPPRSSPSAG